MTGIVNHHDCKLYAIFANPEHVHFLVSRASNMDEERLANLIAEGSSHFINENNLCVGNFQYRIRVQLFQYRKGMWIKSTNIFWDKKNIIINKHLQKNMKYFLNSIRRH